VRRTNDPILHQIRRVRAATVSAIRSPKARPPAPAPDDRISPPNSLAPDSEAPAPALPAPAPEPAAPAPEPEVEKNVSLKTTETIDAGAVNPPIIESNDVDGPLDWLLRRK